MSVCGLEAGELYNGARGIVPHKAYARIGFYLVANQSPDKVEEQLREHLKKHGFGDVKSRTQRWKYSGPYQRGYSVKEMAGTFRGGSL